MTYLRKCLYFNRGQCLTWKNSILAVSFRFSVGKQMRDGVEKPFPGEAYLNSPVAFHFPMRIKIQSSRLLVGSAGSLRMSILGFLYSQFCCSFKQTTSVKGSHQLIIIIFFQKNIHCIFFGRKTISYISVFAFPSLLLYMIAGTYPILTSKNAKHILQRDLVQGDQLAYFAQNCHTALKVLHPRKSFSPGLSGTVGQPRAALPESSHQSHGTS